jgi:transcriptional regulator with XRE-family HTH domain
MAVCGLSGHGAQAKMRALTGWSRATMSQLYNGKQDYSPDILRQASEALDVEAYELLMLPENAMKVRHAVEEAERLVRIAEKARSAGTAINLEKFAKGE